MNLADKIIARREKDEAKKGTLIDYDPGDIDDCGIPVPDEATYDYLCARTLKQHPQLYQRDGGIFEIGKVTPITMKKEDAIWYIGLNHDLLKNGGHVIYWRRLLQLLPELSSDRIMVSDNIYWDTEEGRLKYEKGGN